MLEQPRDALRNAGLRVTPQRVAVLSALHNARGDHLSADDVWEHLSRSSSLLDRSTAYRVLADLTDVGLLTQVRFDDGVARFEVQSRAHHHAVCTHCGSTSDLPDELVAPLSTSLARHLGFTVSPEERLLVRGTCRKCTGREVAGSAR
jgi:Fur family ferric uptake transcriptional regulator